VLCVDGWGRFRNGRSPPIQVKDAWICWLRHVPGGGYMTVINTGAEARVLIGASSPTTERSAFTPNPHRNGMNEMTPVDRLN